MANFKPFYLLIFLAINFFLVFSTINLKEKLKNGLEKRRNTQYNKTRVAILEKVSQAAKHFEESHSNANSDIGICKDAINAILWKFWTSMANPAWVAALEEINKRKIVFRNPNRNIDHSILRDKQLEAYKMAKKKLNVKNLAISLEKNGAECPRLYARLYCFTGRQNCEYEKEYSIKHMKETAERLFIEKTKSELEEDNRQKGILYLENVSSEESISDESYNSESDGS